MSPMEPTPVGSCEPLVWKDEVDLALEMESPFLHEEHRMLCDIQSYYDSRDGPDAAMSATKQLPKHSVSASAGLEKTVASTGAACPANSDVTTDGKTFDIYSNALLNDINNYDISEQLLVETTTSKDIEHFPLLEPLYETITDEDITAFLNSKPPPK